MPAIILTQRHNSPNNKAAPTMNYNYAVYIATRPGVMKLPNQEHGLFGNVSLEGIEDFKEPKDIAKLIYKNSKQKKIMYKDIISFSPTSAEQAGLETLEDWKKYVERHIFTLADGNKIKHQNLQWVAAAHRKKGHPHLHVILWDNSKEVRNPYTSPKAVNEMRKNMIKETYSAQINELIETKNNTKRAIRDFSDDIVDAYEQYLKIKEDNSLFGIFQKGNLDKLMLPKENLEHISLLTKQLIEKVPRKGRLAYSYLPQDAKNILHSIVNYTIKSCPELSSMKNKLIKAQISNVELYNSYKLNVKYYNYDGSIDKAIANRIIKLVKCERNSKEYRKEADNFNNNSAQSLVFDIASYLNTMLQTSNDNANEKTSTDLSKTAKKELYKKINDKGFEH